MPLYCVQMTTISGMSSKDIERIRAPANLPLWKNVCFSAAGGVVGERVLFPLQHFDCYFGHQLYTTTVLSWLCVRVFVCTCFGVSTVWVVLVYV